MSKKKQTHSALAALGSRPALGPLEAQVMEIVWERGDVTVRDVYDVVRQQRDLAYTTVMTVMQNLHRKGLLEKRSEGQANVFAARQSRTEFVRAKVGDLLDALLENFSEPALAHFMDRMRQADPAQLAELERMIAEKRAHERGARHD
jgi:predicted transcriptional regulator